MATSRKNRKGGNPPALRSAAVVGLQKIDLFKGLDTYSLREIASQCKWMRFKRNETVTRRDTADRDVYFLIAGTVRVAAQSGRGRRIILRDVGAGETFGEHSAIDGRKRLADAVALRESVLASMPPEAFRALLANHAPVRERVLRRLTGSVRELADRLVDLGAQSVQCRVWVELLRLGRAAGVHGNQARIERAPTHRDMASRIGTSREQVTRELSRLARQGLLGREGGALVLRDVASLETLAADAAPEADAAAPAPEEPLEFTPVRPERLRRAILVADMLDAMSMMEYDEERTLERWRTFLAYATAEVVPTHAGRSVSKTLGDGFLAEFGDGLQAVRCAFELHNGLARLNASDPARALGMRIGIHVAEVVVETFNILGDGVNVAARLAELANPGETVVSVQVRDQLTIGVDASIEDLGEQRLRNRDRAVRAFRIWPPSFAAPAPRVDEIARTHGRPSIAVVPFRVLSPDPGHEMLGDGLAEETIAALSRVADFFVVSRLSSMAFRHRTHGARGIGELLGVQYVVSGSLQTAGSRALVLAELADARDGRILWSERMEGNLVDIFAMQGDLARAVVARLAPLVRSVELQRARITGFEQLDAFGLLLRGIELMHKASPEDFAHAQDVLKASCERDPTSAWPHAWLAKWHVLRIVVGASPDPAADSRLATSLAERAIDRDPADPVALAVDAFVTAWLKHDLDVTEERVRAALNANPNEPLAWLLNAGAHAWRGRGDEAVEAAERAMSLSPLDPLMYFFTSLASTANLVAGRYTQAVTLAQQSLRANRFHTPSLRALAVGQVLSGDMAGAREAVRALRDLEPALTVTHFRRRYPGRDSPQAETFARALQSAGLPV